MRTNHDTRELSLAEVETLSGGKETGTFKGKRGTTTGRTTPGTVNVHLPNGDVLQFGQNGLAARIGGKWVL